MRKIIIRAVSPKGLKAVQQHKDTYRKVSFKDKMMSKLSGIAHNIDSDSQITLSFGDTILKVIDKVGDIKKYFNEIKGEIIKSFSEYGADLNIDYVIVEEQS